MRPSLSTIVMLVVVSATATPAGTSGGEAHWNTGGKVDVLPSGDDDLSWLESRVGASDTTRGRTAPVFDIGSLDDAVSKARRSTQDNPSGALGGMGFKGLDREDYSKEEKEDVLRLLVRYVGAHKRYVKELRSHDYGRLALDLAEHHNSRADSNTPAGQQQHQQDTDLWKPAADVVDTVDVRREDDKEQLQTDDMGIAKEQVVKTGPSMMHSPGNISLEEADQGSDHGKPTTVTAGATSSIGKDEDGEESDSISSSLLQTSVSEAAMEQTPWYKQKRPEAKKPKPKYDKSQSWWRCSCRSPTWRCSQDSTCSAPRITEEDRLKSEATRQQIAQQTGKEIAPDPFEGKTFHDGALECMMDKTYDCTWTKSCSCEMPWKNVEQCRPLKKITPPICPVKCKKKAWPWNWLCSRWCGCPGCSSPYCHWWFWFTLVCRNHCTCEGKCPINVVTAAP